MQSKTLIVVLVVALMGLVSGQTETLLPTETYPHSAFLNTGQTMQLYWKYNDTHITLEFWGQTTGWIGIGISPNGAMIGADIFVGWVKDGDVHITDRHGDTMNIYPPRDAGDDLELLYGAECGGWTALKFRRQLAACEANSDLEITEDTIRVIWAMGASDPDGSDITSANYHGNAATDRAHVVVVIRKMFTPESAPYELLIDRLSCGDIVVGVKSLLLLGGPGGAPDPTEATSTFVVNNPLFPVPSSNTFYNCRLIQLPTFSSKVHMVKIDPLITSGNEAYVHHMLLYQCTYSTPEQSSNVGTNRQCYTTAESDFQCNLVLHAWAIGGSALNYPAEAGFPLGEASSPKYLILEIHYDNPSGLSTIVDSSGFSIHYTTNLRSMDAGVLEVGHTVNPYSHIIPPGLTSFNTYGECSENCLQLGLQQESITSINLFGVMLHAHLLGTAITLRSIKNGVESKIADDNNYDFNYQETRILSSEVMVDTGSTLQVTCTYDSSGRSGVTVGGLGTTEEMCLAYVYYYPKMGLATCTSAPRIDVLYPAFGVSNYTFIAFTPPYGSLSHVISNDHGGMTLEAVINGMTWNETTGDAHSDATKTMERRFACGTTTSFPTTPNNTGPAPTITTPYTVTVANCSTGAPSVVTLASITSNTCFAIGSASLLSPISVFPILAIGLLAVAVNGAWMANE